MMFVAGELEIVLSQRISALEKLGRLKLLKKITYFFNIYEWHALLKFYAAWFRRIEIGLNKWFDESNEIETSMLAKFPLKGRVQTKKEGVKDQDTAWWCPNFNKHACTISASSHQKHIKGQLRTV